MNVHDKSLGGVGVPLPHRRPKHQEISGRAAGRGMAVRHGRAAVEVGPPPAGFAGQLAVLPTEEELLAAELVAEGRPPALRDFDQIPMQAGDLLRQVKLMQPLLAGKRVAFMGDNDGACPLFGLLGSHRGDVPAWMLLLDFDQRILARAMGLAAQHGFAHWLEARAYNAFDPVPADLAGRYDAFYVNPPYGSHNRGESGRLFITRGMELCHAAGACGCIILPDDDERVWTGESMYATQKFLLDHGWAVREKLNELHRYHLAGDPRLTSSTLWVRDAGGGDGVPPPPYAGGRVPPEAIRHFYGREVRPPYPRYVLESGDYDYGWAAEGGAPDGGEYGGR